ncbi:MAG: lytic murein transglycosylase [Proteobacteria bacterium]|nr:lytic murein transglycosylase [Pseudomonadota bacterium]
MHLLRLGLAAGFVFASIGAVPSFAADGKDEFRTFIDELADDVAKQGMDKQLFYRAFEGNFTPYTRAVELIQQQPESKFSFTKYSASMLSTARIKKGQENFKAYHDTLQMVSDKYGVAPQVIVALWGVETFYGKWPGNHNIIRSLATLAYDSHRKAFFRKELMDAVHILQEGHITPEEMKGSWAGAMGQCQFMPSSFMTFAADGDGDGHKDIWNNPKDVFASTANYLKRSGWQTGKPWGERVVLTKILPPFKVSDRGLSEEMTIAEWKKAGIKAAKGDLPAGTSKARLFMPEGPSKKSYLVYENFDVILRWNRSSYFAHSVLALADEIAKGTDS